MSQKLNSYAGSVIEDRDASTMAEIIAYAFYRALNSGDNINVFDSSVSTEGANATIAGADNCYAELFAKLHTKLDGGDTTTGAHTFKTDGRCIIGRPSFINGLFSKKSGAILLGGDLAQTMLKEYKFDKNINDREFVGNAYKGNTCGFDIQVAADYIWTLAEKYLGLYAGSLNSVKAICLSFECTAAAKVVDLGAKTIDANEIRGIKVQPLNMWGHEAIRKSQLIGSTSLTTTNIAAIKLTDNSTNAFSSSTRKHPVAPADLGTTDFVTLPIYDNDGTCIGYKRVAAMPSPNVGKTTGKTAKSVAYKDGSNTTNFGNTSSGGTSSNG